MGDAKEKAHNAWIQQAKRGIKGPTPTKKKGKA